jgi:hypothetical protein
MTVLVVAKNKRQKSSQRPDANKGRMPQLASRRPFLEGDFCNQQRLNPFSRGFRSGLLGEGAAGLRHISAQEPVQFHKLLARESKLHLAVRPNSHG